MKKPEKKGILICAKIPIVKLVVLIWEDIFSVGLLLYAQDAERMTRDVFNMKFLNWLWFKIYKRWLYHPSTGCYDKVIRVKGWRSALIEDKWGQRSTITPIFWWFK